MCPHQLASQGCRQRWHGRRSLLCLVRVRTGDCGPGDPMPGQGLSALCIIFFLYNNTGFCKMPLVMWWGLLLFQVRWEAPGLPTYLTRMELLVTFCKLAHSDSGSHGSYSQMPSGTGHMELSTWCRYKNVSQHLPSKDTSCTESGIFWVTLGKLEALTLLTLW